jgi:pimeloyl-ACP methyl ester carboxylesterase
MSIISPSVQFAKGSKGWVAYEVMGEGPVDIVLLTGPLSHLDLMWDEPSCASFLRNLASFSRLIIFDSTGIGLSDPVPDGIIVPGQIVDDFRAVMDASRTEHAAIVGVSGGGSMAALIAAALPERVSAIILYGAYAKLGADPEYPWGSSLGRPAEEVALQGRLRSHNVLNPTVHDDRRVSEWSERFFRSAASPGVIRDVVTMMRELDIRPVLGQLTVPALVIARENDAYIAVENSRYLAAHVPNSELVELPGVDHHPWFGDAGAVIDAIERFLVGPNSRSRRGKSQLGAKLTRREEEVVALANAGLTAAEIGKRLLISARTVETHVAHAYAKLGINSRSELHHVTG